jgi:hypothetical protein
VSFSSSLGFVEAVSGSNASQDEVSICWTDEIQTACAHSSTHMFFLLTAKDYTVLVKQLSR